MNKLKLWQKLKPVASGEKIEQLKEVDEKEKRSRLRSILLGEERQARLKIRFELFLRKFLTFENLINSEGCTLNTI